MKQRDRKLGMDRDITRRDFIGGVGMALTGSLFAPWSPARAVEDGRGAPGFPASAAGGVYPPGLTGMRGSHDGSFEFAHALRDGTRVETLGPVRETGEEYDLVVVGAGISGLAAAYQFRERAGPQSRILLIDNHDDFGGHAKRNEFRFGDRTLLGTGGTMNIEDFDVYGPAAQKLIRSLGIDVDRFGEFLDEEIYESRKLREGIFFEQQTFGVDRLVLRSDDGGWQQAISEMPFSPATRAALRRLYSDEVDYLPGRSFDEKRGALAGMTYRAFLTDLAGIDQDGLRLLGAMPQGYWAIGSDAAPALLCQESGYPGFAGMGFPADEGHERTFRFPDGNSSIARLMVRAMIPNAAPGHSMESIVTARFDYAQLDRASNPVRVRLGSMGLRVAERADEQGVDITYARGGALERVRGEACILAGYNAMIPYICPSLPDAQKQALSYAYKAPLVYTRVLIRNWTSFERLGLRRAYCPGSFHVSVRLGDPVSMGGYRCPRTPEEPMVLFMNRIPLAPGLPAPEQWRSGRRELLSMEFETFEREIRGQLGRLLGPGGFDPARDIAAITVNRWPHGYAYGCDPASGEVAWSQQSWPESKRTWERARKPFGRIAIANSDAGANAMTEAAIGEAHRAVGEIFAARA